MGKQNMYEHTIGVPFIMRGPGVPRDNRLDAQIYLRDMYPTTCEMAGIKIPETVDGRSLVPLLQGKVDQIYSAIYGCFFESQRMIRTDRWKLIGYPEIDRYQLFDLESDPKELRDLAGSDQHDELMEALRERMDEWFSSQLKPR